MIYYKDLNGYDKLLIVNGCKPEWMPKWVQVDLIFGCSCNQHDVDYFAGGLEADRLEADKKFLESMKNRIKQSKLCCFKKWLLKRAANSYYKLVRKFGDSTFEYRHRKTEDGKLVSYQLQSALSLPSYSPQIDYRLKTEGVKIVKHNNRWYLQSEMKPN